MKVNELMIGDWVSYIPEIEEGEDSYLEESRNVQVDLPCLNLIDELIFAPIPLTAEILERNGFISYPQDRIIIWRNDYSFAMECDLTTWEYYWANGDVRINYVHELQHALRLCGLNELADNFKI